MNAIGIVAGSGIDLRPLLDEVIEEIPFAHFGDVGTEIAGHARTFVLGRCAGHDMILQRGRLHLYEGLSLETVGAAVDWLAQLGAKEMVFTNAAGGLAEGLHAGALVAVRRMRAWPFQRRNGPETVDPDQMVSVCDGEGVYWWMHGPCYETPAEIAALKSLGGTVVGMSTLPEVERAQRIGIPAAVISCVTNVCGAGPVTHGEVLRVSAEASARLCGVLRRYLASNGRG